MFLQIHEHLTIGAGSHKLSDLKKARIAELIAQTDFNLLMGGNEELNILNSLSSIGQILSIK